MRKLALAPPTERAFSVTPKPYRQDRKGSERRKSFTAKDTKDAEEKNSLTAKDAK